ncbi:MAG: hypothetical protein ACKO01_13085, partial [Erythrobacter sp.]
VLRDAAGKETARAITDFDGFVLFEALPFGTYRAEAAGQAAGLTVSCAASDAHAKLLIAPAAGA